MGGLSIIRPVPITKMYRMAATVSQMPLAKNAMARGFNEFGIMIMFFFFISAIF
jgi:hypothetical protein